MKKLLSHLVNVTLQAKNIIICILTVGITIATAGMLMQGYTNPLAGFIIAMMAICLVLIELLLSSVKFDTENKIP